MASNNKCPIWGTSAETQPSRRDGVNVDSPRAGGRYFISGTAEVNMRRTDDGTKARLTTWLVDQRRLGIECPEIMSTTINEAEHRRPLSVHERADRLLEFLGNSSEFVGDDMSIKKPTDFMRFLAFSESVDEKEVDFLFEILLKREFIVQEMASVYERRGLIGTGPELEEYVDRRITITADGYVYLAELEAKAVDSKQAFVAMWFNDSMRDAYENGIAAGIEGAGY